jgi:hypothetical protein
VLRACSANDKTAATLAAATKPPSMVTVDDLMAEIPGLSTRTLPKNPALCAG